MDRYTHEFERKWLVRDLPALGGLKWEQINQGYLAIWCKGDTCFETIKSPGGLTRDEIDVEISQEQFRVLWPVTEGRRL